MKLAELKTDEGLLELRPINLFVVNKYQQAYRSGSQFPPIKIDKDTKTIVSGNHRYQAMLNEFGKDYDVEVIQASYSDRKALLVDFAKENSDHGMPLTGFSKRKITLELLDEGVKDNEIAHLFGVSVKRIEEWAGQTVVVVGGSGKSQYETVEPVKRGPEIQGKTITEEQYAKHRRADIGVKADKMIDQLNDWFANGWIRQDTFTKSKVAQLADYLTDYLK